MKRITSTYRFSLVALGLFFALSALATPALASSSAEAEPGHDAHATHAPDPINWTSFSYKDKNVHGEEFQKGDTPMAPPLVAAFINFSIFGFLIIWKGGPPIMKHVRNKHTTIKSSLEEAAKLRAEAREKLAEFDKRIADVDGEVDALVKGIRADADSEKKRIIEHAEAQAAAMKKEAEDRIEAEIARARIQLEREVVAVAIAAAEKVLREKAMPADQKDLADTFITGLAAQTSQPEERS
jgi:F-type H+-transporting ATPase subunit b